MLQFTKEKNNNKNGKVCTKILFENSYHQKQENLLLEQSATKLVCILYGEKVDLVFTENKQNVKKLNKIV